MKKLILILCVLLLSMSAIHAVDHFLGPVCIDGELSLWYLYVNAGFTYETAIFDYFGLAHYLTIGFSLPQAEPGINIRYAFYPQFKVGNEKFKFLFSALGFSIINSYAPTYKSYRLQLGPAETIGLEVHPTKYSYVIYKLELFVHSFFVFYRYKNIYQYTDVDYYTYSYFNYPVGGISFSILFNVGKNRKEEIDENIP